MDKVEQLQKLFSIVEKDTKKVFAKDNRSAGKRARKALRDIYELIIPFRKEILSKMESIPKKPKKNNNEIYLNRRKNDDIS